MLYQQVVCVLLAAILVNLLLNLRSLRRAEAEGEVPDPPPLISVLIPARDEEANIGACLDSLRREDYPRFEVLVLDDGSTDGTAGIVEKVAAEDRRVRLIRGQPLAAGWAGKPFACHQLAREARGDWLLFTDADTVHAPSALRQVLLAAVGSHAALISGFPHQRTTSFWQKVAIPVMFYFALLCWLPLWWFQRTRRAVPSVAIGQFLFFSAEAYRGIGGHEAVKARILEDVWLGREMARHHYKQLTLDLSPLVSCQMYRGFRSMWNGIARWLYSLASMSVAMLMVAMVVAVLLFLMPFLWLAYGLFLAQPALGWEVLVALQVAILYVARFLAGRRFSQPASSAILHPLGIAFLVVAALYASLLRLRGSGVEWKGRVYDAESRVA